MKIFFEIFFLEIYIISQ